MLTYVTVRDVHYYKCDVSDYSQIHQVADTIRSEHGNPSVLINNAGIGRAFRPSYPLLFSQSDPAV